MATVFYDKDAQMSMLEGKTVAILGYGSQGHAHAQNLRDSGVSVVVGLHQGSASAAKARQDGFEVCSVEEAAQRGDVIMFLIPDHLQPKVYRDNVASHMKPGAALAFAHGFAIHFNQVVPPSNVDVFMVAPKGPGHILRRTFTQGKGVPALLAVYQDYSGTAWELGKAYASAIGAGRAGVLVTTFEEETETDLFGEQAVLCGGLCELMKAGFETLTEAGYQPELAYFECVNEMKLIVDMIYEGGLAWMRYSISDTAEYGDMTGGPAVIGPEARKGMAHLLAQIQSGAFARDWIIENQTGRPQLAAWRSKVRKQPLEEVGAQLRAMMPWLEAKEAPMQK